MSSITDSEILPSLLDKSSVCVEMIFSIPLKSLAAAVPKPLVIVTSVKFNTSRNLRSICLFKISNLVLPIRDKSDTSIGATMVFIFSVNSEMVSLVAPGTSSNSSMYDAPFAASVTSK